MEDAQDWNRLATAIVCMCYTRGQPVQFRVLKLKIRWCGLRMPQDSSRAISQVALSCFVIACPAGALIDSHSVLLGLKGKIVARRAVSPEPCRLHRCKAEDKLNSEPW